MVSIYFHIAHSLLVVSGMFGEKSLDVVHSWLRLRIKVLFSFLDMVEGTSTMAPARLFAHCTERSRIEHSQAA